MDYNSKKETMINTKDFKTRTVYEQKSLICPQGTYPIGADIGYSSVKMLTPNKMVCFPAHAMLIPKDRTSIREPEPTDIRIEDEHGIWVVGEQALQEARTSDSTEFSQKSQIRNRFRTPMFQAITEAMYGMALQGNKFMESPNPNHIYVQSGLPALWLKEDAAEFREHSLCKELDFSITVGYGPRRDYHFRVPEERTFLMAQPLASFFSACLNKKGDLTPDAKKLFQSTVLVHDPGYGTEDEYLLRQGDVINEVTNPKLAMQEIFKRTIQELNETHSLNPALNLSNFQYYLGEGKISVKTKRVRPDGRVVPGRKEYPFADILEKHAQDVAYNNVDHLYEEYNDFDGIQYLIETGGLSNYWMDIFEEELADFETLKVLSANRNDTSIDNIFSNARGYYYKLVNALKQRGR